MQCLPDMRTAAMQLFDLGVVAADPAMALSRIMLPEGRLNIVAIGKAAPKMAAAILARTGPVPCLIVTHHGNDAPVAGARVMAAGHPVPDQDGEGAAAAVLAMARGLGAEDTLIVLISGGASAMLPAPVKGLTLQDKIAVNRILLASGADIRQINLVRQNLSELKGGGLARAAGPARVVSYILSDVIGDDLRAVASGPTLPPLGDAAAARGVLTDLGLWDALPDRVRAHLISPSVLPETTARNEVHLIGSNQRSIDAMLAALPTANQLPQPLEGDVQDAAEALIAHWPAPGGALITGGETTVRLQGKGLGGRNQELALRVAILAEARGFAPDWVFLSGGTDGRDGPTDAAGGVVDGESLSRMRAAGIDPAANLAQNDSYAALHASGDLILIGATGTNVADLQIILRQP